MLVCPTGRNPRAEDPTKPQKTLPSLSRPYQASADPTKPQKTLSSRRRPYQASEDPYSPYPTNPNNPRSEPTLRRPYQASEDPTKLQKTLSSLRRPYQASEDPTIGAVTGREVNAHQKERGLFWCSARCPKETFGVLDAHQKRHTKRTPKKQQSTPKTPNSKLAHRTLV